MDDKLIIMGCPNENCDHDGIKPTRIWNKTVKLQQYKCEISGSGRIRTDDLWLRKPLRYPDYATDPIYYNNSPIYTILL